MRSPFTRGFGLILFSILLLACSIFTAIQPAAPTFEPILIDTLPPADTQTSTPTSVSSVSIPSSTTQTGIRTPTSTTTASLTASATYTSIRTPTLTPTHETPTHTPSPTFTQIIPTPDWTPGATNERRILILYTSDEHGWMEGKVPGQGAENMASLWKEQISSPYDSVIILSGGDNWDGPPISTMFNGQSMVDVMNAMGYEAAAIGNHEFDLPINDLKERFSEANFPYLAANIRYINNGRVPTDIGIQPYAILDLDGLQVGIIGLSLMDTPRLTVAKHVNEFEFLDYEEVLREYVPQVRDEGAELVFVVAHVCIDEMINLASQVTDLGLEMLTGAHCNRLFAGLVGDSVMLSSGINMASYAFARFTYDIESGEIRSKEFGYGFNNGGEKDVRISEIVVRWRQELNSSTIPDLSP